MELGRLLMPAAVRECVGCESRLRAGTKASACGFCVEEALRGLTGGAPVSAQAVWFLREQGLSARAVVLARRALQRGASVAEVGDRIRGAVQ